MKYKLTSKYKPTGDQPEAIKQLTEGINRGDKYQTLLGVTGSGKTFTVANMIERVHKPILVLSHNKTLAAQLMVSSRNSFLKMRWNILCRITIIISPRLISLLQI